VVRILGGSGSHLRWSRRCWRAESALEDEQYFCYGGGDISIGWGLFGWAASDAVRYTLSAKKMCSGGISRSMGSCWIYRLDIRP